MLVLLTVIGVIAVLFFAAKRAAARRGRGQRCYPLPQVVGLVTAFAMLAAGFFVGGMTSPGVGCAVLGVWFILEGVFDAWKSTDSAERLFADPAPELDTDGPTNP